MEVLRPGSVDHYREGGRPLFQKGRAPFCGRGAPLVALLFRRQAGRCRRFSLQTWRRVARSINILGEGRRSVQQMFGRNFLAIQAQFSYLYLLRSEKISNEEDFQVLLDSDWWPESLDLAPQVWESFILSLPPKVLCSPDCKGLCPNCGQNLNVGTCSCKEEEGDPRLAALKLYKEMF